MNNAQLVAIQRVKADKERMQKLIRDKYPKLVKINTEELCFTCGIYYRGGCMHGLIPCTLTGEPCPYYHKSEGD